MMTLACDAMRAATATLYAAHDATPVISVDTVIDIDQISHDLIDQIQSLRPFGIGFESPLFMLRDVSLPIFPLGQTGDHIKWESGSGLDIIGFHMAEYTSLFQAAPHHLIGTLQTRTWRDKKTIQFQVVDAMTS